MLSESVLADLAQKGPLREHLLAMAWPSLGVPEKLQVIQAIQTEGASRVTEDWLMDLALADPAPVVRFWGARYGTFPSRKPAEPTPGNAGPHVSEKSLSHTDKVAADENALVRACLADIDRGANEAFTKAPQVTRLVALRTAHAHSDAWVVDWLTKAIMARVPTHDLRDCASEFFGRPDVQRELLKDDFDDGVDAHTAGESLRKAWALVRVADASVGLQLARVLPLNRGLYTIDAEELLDYPVPILRALIFRSALEPAMAPLMKRLEERVDALPEDLRKDLADAHPVGDMDIDGEAVRLRSEMDRSRAILDAVLGLRSRIDTLEATVLDAGKVEDVKPKRWGFSVPPSR